MIESKALKIIKRPYITEKTFDIMEKQNKMVFIVEEKSNKYDIKNYVFALIDYENKNNKNITREKSVY